jgi:DNA-3-methyladenine glycosylase
MFEAGGIAYVYLVYGVHHCLNVVTGPKGYPAAILLRATEPPCEDRSASGPGRLTRAFEIDRGQDRASFAGRRLWIEEGEVLPERAVRRTPRIGVDYAGSWARRPYRFVVSGHHAASGPARLR